MKFEEFRKLCHSYSVPFKVTYEWNNPWDNAIEWALNNNRINFFENLIKQYPDQEKLNDKLVFERDYLLTSSFKKRTSLKTFKKLIEYTGFNPSFVKMESYIQGLCEQENFNVLSFIIKKSEEIGLLNLKEMALIKSIKYSSLKFIEKILSLSPNFEYEHHYDFKFSVTNYSLQPFSIIYNCFDKVIKDTNNIQLFNMLLEKYNKEFKWDNEKIIKLLETCIDANNSILLEEILTNKVLSPILNKNILLNEWNEIDKSYTKKKICYFSNKDVTENYTKVLKILKNYGIYEINSITKLLNIYLDNNNTQAYEELLTEVDIPPYEDKSKIIILLCKKYLNNNNEEACKKIINNEKIRGNCEKIKLLSTVISAQNIKLIESFSETKDFENKILRNLRNHNLFNTIYAENVLNKYISLKSLRDYYENYTKSNNVQDKWLEIMLLTKELEDKAIPSDKQERKLKI